MTQVVNLTEAAVFHIQKAIEKRGAGIGIRFGIKKVGCTGYAYVTEYVDQPIAPALEQIFEGFTVFIKPEDERFVTGLMIDYTRKGFQEGFQFNNPNEKARCGCGSSFSM